VTSSAEAQKAMVEALRKHPRRVMTSTELAARAGVTDPADLATCVNQLRARGLVATHDAIPADPHLPAIRAVALVGPGETDDADERARRCAAVLERQLLRSHRCH
jgi:hypothetical protein